MGLINLFKAIGAKPSPQAPSRRRQELFKAGPIQERFQPGEESSVADWYSPADLADFLTLYSNHPWVFVCAHAIATAAASVQWQVLKNGTEITADKRAKFLVKPNPYQTWYELIETSFLHLELTGNAFWEVERDGKGKDVVAIYLLRPDRVKILPDPKTKIRGYKYDVGGKSISFDPEDVLHLKYPDPANEYMGVAPIFAAKNDITLDFWITAWNKKFFKDGAIPGGVIKAPGELSPDAWDRIRATWYKFHQGVDKAHSIAILEQGATYEPISTKHADMQYKDQKIYSREVVLSTMRVPPVMIGLTEGVSYATSREQKKIFYQDNIIPKLLRLQDAIDIFLMPDDIEFKFVTRSIDSLIEDDQVKSAIANQNVTHGIMTINEVRERYYGLEPVEWGKGYWVPMGLTFVDRGVPLNQPQGQNGAGSVPAIEDGDDAGLKDPSQVPAVRQSQKKNAEILTSVDLEKIEAASPDWADHRSVENWRAWTFWKNTAGPDDRIIRRKLKELFDDQVLRVKTKVEALWPVRDSGSVEKAEFQKAPRDMEIEDYFDMREEEGRLRSVLVSEAERLLKKHGNLQLAEFGIESRFKMRNPRVEKFLEEYGGTRIRNISKTTASIVRDQLTKAQEGGEDYKQVLRRLTDHFDGEGGISASRAQLIARTEVVTLTNTARHEAALQSDVATRKRWVSEMGASTRQREGGENHVDLHNQEIDLTAKFIAKNRTGTEELDCPGDINASAENACGCLCICVYSAGTGAFDDITVDDLRTSKAQGQDVVLSKEVVPSGDSLGFEAEFGICMTP